MAVEGIFVIGASGALKRLVYVVASEISLAWGVEDELKKLKETLELIAAITSDAETKQVNSSEVSLWLKRLKEDAYDAEDLLDEFSYEAMRPSEKRSFNKEENLLGNEHVQIYVIQATIALIPPLVERSAEELDESDKKQK